MAKEKSNSIYAIVSTSIAVLLMIALIGALASQTNEVTSLTQVTETLNLASARNATNGQSINSSVLYTLTDDGSSGWRNDETTCKVTTIVVKNGTGTVLENNGCALGGDYVYTAYTNLYFCNTLDLNQTTSNTTTVTYMACPDGYQTTSWGRNILGVTIGLIAFAILIVVIAFVLRALSKEE